MTGGVSGTWHPAVEDVVAIHEEIVSEYPETEPGVRSRGDIEFAVEYARRVGSGKDDAAVHAEAFHLLRLLTANHPFVDGNKRTALDVTATFYFFNGFEFDYDHEIRTILTSLATDETSVDREQVLQYLRSTTEPIELDAEVDEWREDLVQRGLDRLEELRDDSNDQSS